MRIGSQHFFSTHLLYWKMYSIKYSRASAMGQRSRASMEEATHHHVCEFHFHFADFHFSFAPFPLFSGEPPNQWWRAEVSLGHHLYGHLLTKWHLSPRSPSLAPSPSRRWAGAGCRWGDTETGGRGGNSGPGL